MSLTVRVCPSIVRLFSGWAWPTYSSSPMPKSTHLQLFQGQSTPPPISFKRPVPSSIHPSILVFLRWCIIPCVSQCSGAPVEPRPRRILLSSRCSFYPPSLWAFPSALAFLPHCLLRPPPFCSIFLLLTLPVVMTPSSRMMLVWSNCPRMAASLRKERRCLSEQPARNVFMATGSSLLLGSFRQPRQTSPKSPVMWEQKGSHAPLINLQRKSSLAITGRADDM